LLAGPGLLLPVLGCCLTSPTTGAVACMLWAGDVVTYWVGGCRGCWLVLALSLCHATGKVSVLHSAHAVLGVPCTHCRCRSSELLWLPGLSVAPCGSCHAYLFVGMFPVCSRTFPHQRRDLSHCWQLCGVSAFAVGGRAVSGRADSRTPVGACGLLVVSHRWGPVAPLAVSHRWGPAAPLAISHRWGPAAPLAISQVRCRRSMGSVIACVKVALRAQLDRQGKH
jgi:hypothetical protein